MLINFKHISNRENGVIDVIHQSLSFKTYQLMAHLSSTVHPPTFPSLDCFEGNFKHYTLSSLSSSVDNTFFKKDFYILLSYLKKKNHSLISSNIQLLLGVPLTVSHFFLFYSRIVHVRTQTRSAHCT